MGKQKWSYMWHHMQVIPNKNHTQVSVLPSHRWAFTPHPRVLPPLLSPGLTQPTKTLEGAEQWGSSNELQINSSFLTAGLWVDLLLNYTPALSKQAELTGYPISYQKGKEKKKRKERHWWITYWKMEKDKDPASSKMSAVIYYSCWFLKIPPHIEMNVYDDKATRWIQLRMQAAASHIILTSS